MNDLGQFGALLADKPEAARAIAAQSMMDADLGAACGRLPSPALYSPLNRTRKSP